MLSKTNKKKANASVKRSAINAERMFRSVEQVPAAYGTKGRSTTNAPSSNKVVIRRRECVGSVVNNGTGFNLTNLSRGIPGYDLNPANAILFPWLSTIAPSYERFRFNKVKVELVSGTPTSIAGRVYLAVDYDYDDQVADSKITMMNNASVAEGSVWQNVEVTCDPSALNRDLPYRYVSCTTRTLFPEGRTSFAGFIMVAYDTLVSVTHDLWVEYEVELVTPVLDVLDQVSVGVTAAAAPLVSDVVPAGTLALPLFCPGGSAGGINIVRSGTPGVPPCNFTSGGGNVYPNDIIDLGNVHSGNLTVNAISKVTSDTPANQLLANIRLGLQVFDSFGNALGTVYSAVSTIKAQLLSGLATPPMLSTANQWAFLTAGFTLALLAKAYPTYRYLVPYLQADTPLAGGNAAFGYLYNRV